MLIMDTSCAIPSDGDSGALQTRSDDGSLAIVDGELVVNKDG